MHSMELLNGGVNVERNYKHTRIQIAAAALWVFSEMVKQFFIRFKRMGMFEMPLKKKKK